MSIETNVLDKLGVLAAIGPKITSFAPNLNVRLQGILWKNFRQKRDWPSTVSSDEFQRETMARRAFNEILGRQSLAR
ncbi:MAG: hypothetical protein WB661_12845 [Candidatus Bathyarchaeia archaeon]